MDGSPDIRSIRAGDGRTLVVTWKGGAEIPVDIAEPLARYAVFAPLRLDDAAFRAVSVGEWGWNAKWKSRRTCSGGWRWNRARHGFGHGERRIE